MSRRLLFERLPWPWRVLARALNLFLVIIGFLTLIGAPPTTGAILAIALIVTIIALLGFLGRGGE